MGCEATGYQHTSNLSGRSLKKIQGVIARNSLNNVTLLLSMTNNLYLLLLLLFFLIKNIQLYLFTPALNLTPRSLFLLPHSSRQREDRINTKLLVSVSIFGVCCKHLNTCICYQQCVFKLCCPKEEKLKNDSFNLKTVEPLLTINYCKKKICYDIA